MTTNMRKSKVSPNHEVVPEESRFLSMAGYLLRRCHQIGVAIFLDECRASDLTPLQFSVLSALDGFGPMDQARLGGVAALDRTTIVVVLTKLEERGMITREPSEKDKRAKIVSITDTGRQILADVMPNVEESQRRLLGPLNVREQAQLIALLGKLAEANNRLSRAPHRLP